MQSPLFPLSHPVGRLSFLRSVILHQAFIQPGRKRNLVGIVYHLDRREVNFVIVGRYLRLDECRESAGCTSLDEPFGTGGEGMRTVTV